MFDIESSLKILLHECHESPLFTAECERDQSKRHTDDGVASFLKYYPRLIGVVICPYSRIIRPGGLSLGGLAGLAGGRFPCDCDGVACVAAGPRIRNIVRLYRRFRASATQATTGMLDGFFGEQPGRGWGTVRSP